MQCLKKTARLVPEAIAPIRKHLNSNSNVYQSPESEDDTVRPKERPRLIVSSSDGEENHRTKAIFWNVIFLYLTLHNTAFQEFDAPFCKNLEEFI
ncbi:hypothetical protein WN51_06475 [Melipona quadrifasciata]|uniref:Uncharacterized protein n=1 Tax=Melipona quadrifasciata TaxID=166423 RepID=A0A0M9A9N9_9HYME|nr:hypothetical protein WN51_06475 [Melipona quadrifasciata]